MAANAKPEYRICPNPRCGAKVEYKGVMGWKCIACGSFPPVPEEKVVAEPAIVVEVRDQATRYVVDGKAYGILDAALTGGGLCLEAGHRYEFRVRRLPDERIVKPWILRGAHRSGENARLDRLLCECRAFSVLYEGQVAPTKCWSCGAKFGKPRELPE